MSNTRSYLSLKIGLLIVAIVWFLFSFHELVKAIAAINEYVYVSSTILSSWIQITDIFGVVGLVIRTVAGFTAFAVILFYLVKKKLSTPTTFKVLRGILVAEAIYWMSIFIAGLWCALPVGLSGWGGGVIIGAGDLSFNLGLIIETAIPCLAGAIAIPTALFKLASTLKSNKSTKRAIKWGLIAGTVYIFVFWLNNIGNWIYTIMVKGAEYLTFYPENLLSFSLSSIGLLALGIFAAYFTRKSTRMDTREGLKLRTIGIIIVALGLCYFWNYLTWIYFGRPEVWSAWYAWFLGHNMDLWILSIPLVGLPLLFERRFLDIHDD